MQKNFKGKFKSVLLSTNASACCSFDVKWLFKRYRGLDRLLENVDQPINKSQCSINSTIAQNKAETSWNLLLR